MKIAKTRSELDSALILENNTRIKTGFVPTMGALHPGHISLIEKAKLENDLVICSIFVNPTQFNDPKDLDKYPRPIENDLILLEKAGCDLVFLPEVAEMYSGSEEWNHDFKDLEKKWEGAMRPGHFKGVGQIVYKLFDYLKPFRAYFGQKDFQQTLIVKQLVKDFNLDTEIIVCPIIREQNGLAMSSRNVRLSPEEREKAGIIYKVLLEAKKKYTSDASIQAIVHSAKEMFNTEALIELEYIGIVNSENLEEMHEKSPNTTPIMLIALRISGTRLIDNMYLLD